MCRRGERKRESQGLGVAVDHMVFRPVPCDDGSDGSVLLTFYWRTLSHCCWFYTLSNTPVTISVSHCRRTHLSHHGYIQKLLHTSHRHPHVKSSYVFHLVECVLVRLWVMVYVRDDVCVCVSPLSRVWCYVWSSEHHSQVRGLVRW